MLPKIAKRTQRHSRNTSLIPIHELKKDLISELDELMTSLNNFKMADNRNVDEPVRNTETPSSDGQHDKTGFQVISGPPTLDDMLGNLQEDMHKQVTRSQLS